MLLVYDLYSKIWKEGEDSIADFGRSMHGFPRIIAGLLYGGVEPEKINLKVVSEVYIDCYGKNLNVKIVLGNIVWCDLCIFYLYSKY